MYQFLRVLLLRADLNEEEKKHSESDSHHDWRQVRNPIPFHWMKTFKQQRISDNGDGTTCHRESGELRTQHDAEFYKGSCSNRNADDIEEERKEHVLSDFGNSRTTKFDSSHNVA